jgi:hypothetical protein
MLSSEFQVGIDAQYHRNLKCWYSRLKLPQNETEFILFFTSFHIFGISAKLLLHSKHNYLPAILKENMYQKVMYLLR